MNDGTSVLPAPDQAGPDGGVPAGAHRGVAGDARRPLRRRLAQLLAVPASRRRAGCRLPGDRRLRRRAGGHGGHRRQPALAGRWRPTSRTWTGSAPTRVWSACRSTSTWPDGSSGGTEGVSVDPIAVFAPRWPSFVVGRPKYPGIPAVLRLARSHLDHEAHRSRSTRHPLPGRRALPAERPPGRRWRRSAARSRRSPGRTAQHGLDIAGEVRVVPVEDAGEQVGERPDLLSGTPAAAAAAASRTGSPAGRRSRGRWPC